MRNRTLFESDLRLCRYNSCRLLQAISTKNAVIFQSGNHDLVSRFFVNRTFDASI